MDTTTLLFLAAGVVTIVAVIVIFGPRLGAPHDTSKTDRHDGYDGRPGTSQGEAGGD